MRRPLLVCQRGVLAGALLLLLPMGAASARPAPGRLVHAQPTTMAIDFGQTRWDGVFHASAGTKSFAVQVAGDADADIYLRRGQPFGIDTVGEADLSARAEGPRDELFVEGPLAVGEWHVRVEAEEVETKGTIEIVLLLDEAGTPAPLLPAQPQPADEYLAEDGKSLAAALWVPSSGVEAATITLIDPPRNLTRRTYELRKVGGEKPVVVGSGTLRSVIPIGDAEGPLELHVMGGTKDDWGPKSRLRFDLRLEDDEEPPEVLTMQVGQTQQIDMGGDERSVRRIRIEGVEGRLGVVIEAETDDASDIDLYARRGKDPSDYEEEAEWFSLSTQDTERLVLRGDRALPAGDIYCLIELVDDDDAQEVTIRVQPVEASDSERAWGTEAPATLNPRSWTSGHLVADEDNGQAWYRLDVPKGTRSIHARVLDADAPIDLLLTRTDDGAIVRRSLSPLVDEHLDVAFPSPTTEQASWLVTVISRDPYEEDIPYRFAVDFDKPPTLPAGARWPRMMAPKPERPHQTVMAATVEITMRDHSGGSGTCVTPSGHILTCQHVLVLEDTDEVQTDNILISFVDRIDRPPVQTYRAKLIYEDDDLDLALLELTGDVYGRPMAAQPNLPYLPMGDPSILGLGDGVTVYGYPADGSERARTPIILSRGVVSGLEADTEGLAWIKTDAWVGSGHSGGTLVGSDRTLLGVPSATLGKLEVLGLAVPVSRIPAPWRKVIDDALPKQARGAGPR